MMLPTIHLNGSGPKSLLEQNRAAWNALRQAVEALDLAAPNGRDYYPQGNHAIGEAMREHTERVKPLLKAMRDLEAINEHIYDSGKV
jgi:hypothetical protein